MNRSRRVPVNKSFVPGGVYDPKLAATASPVRNYSYQVAAKRQAPGEPQSPIPQKQQLISEQTCQTQQTESPTPQLQSQVPQNQSETTDQPPETPNQLAQKPVMAQQLTKEEYASTVNANASSTNEDEVVTDENGEKRGKLQFKKIFLTRKKSSVRAKEKKIRQNRQLRKVILPKNALMALNEVKGITIGDFLIISNPGGGFKAMVTVNNNMYEGTGTSKVIAKNNACEKALRDFILSKMRQHPRRPSRPASSDNSMEIGEDETGVDSDGGETSEKTSTDDVDDVPMINLASFALYKLFSEWESEGFEIPEFHPSAAGQTNANDSDSGSTKEPKKPPVRNELPPNWETLHPATLLCMMRPGLTYSDYGVVGEKPNTIQSMGVIVDGREFVGKGRSKKIARRNTAAAVCNELFGTNFPSEDPSAPA